MSLLCKIVKMLACDDEVKTNTPIEKVPLIRAKVMEIAKSQVGEKEIPGRKHNPDIVKYWKAVNNIKVSDDETPWCAAFVNWCLLEAGLPGTGKANARSFMKWGEPTSNPQEGDIVVYWRVKKNGWQGHVGFFSHFEKNLIVTLGGNQSNEVRFSRYSKDKLLGFRKVDRV